MSRPLVSFGGQFLTEPGSEGEGTLRVSDTTGAEALEARERSGKADELLHFSRESLAKCPDRELLPSRKAVLTIHASADSDLLPP